MKTILLAATLLGGFLALHGLPQAEAQKAACVAAPGPDGYVRLRMTKIAAHTSEDPHGVWSKFAIWNPNTPNGTDIYEATTPTCQGTLIVSQIVNRQCGSAMECPGRVVLRQTNGEMRTLMNYKQICTAADGLSVKSDLSEIVACGIPHDLD